MTSSILTFHGTTINSSIFPVTFLKGQTSRDISWHLLRRNMALESSNGVIRVLPSYWSRLLLSRQPRVATVKRLMNEISFTPEPLITDQRNWKVNENYTTEGNKLACNIRNTKFRRHFILTISVSGVEAFRTVIVRLNFSRPLYEEISSVVQQCRAKRELHFPWQRVTGSKTSSTKRRKYLHAFNEVHLDRETELGHGCSKSEKE